MEATFCRHIMLRKDYNLLNFYSSIFISTVISTFCYFKFLYDLVRHDCKLSSPVDLTDVGLMNLI